MTMTKTGPRWEPTDEYDLLDALADPHPIIGADVPELFLDACARDAATHDGLVSVNRVRARLADHKIPARRYSALWAHFTGLGKPMTKATDPETNEQLCEVCKGSESGNDGRPYPLRRWTGVDNNNQEKT